MIGFPHLPVDMGGGGCLRVPPFFQLPPPLCFAITYNKAYGVQLPIEIVVTADAEGKDH